MRRQKVVGFLIFGLAWFDLVYDRRWLHEAQHRFESFTQGRSSWEGLEQNADMQEDPNEPVQRLQHLAQTIPAAAFVWERYQAYLAAGDGERWKYRGLGYLYWTHGLILEARMDGKSIVIRNVAPNTTLRDCHLFSLWVRLEGLEIFAGRPIAVEHDGTTPASACHWEYTVPHLQQAGTYRIDVKLLVWNGQAPIQLMGGSQQTASQCALANEALNEQSPVMSLSHEGIRGFKLYAPITSCCEICTRLSNCKHWATPPVNFTATYVNNGCEFFFENEHDVIPPSKHLGPRRRRRLGGAVPTAYGTPHKNPVAYFMGCGWSYWFTLDYPCLSGDLDDRVFVVESEIDFQADNTSLSIAYEELPLCTALDEQRSDGRWVRGPEPFDCPAYTRDKNFVSKFDIAEFTVDRPHCWHRDDFSAIGNRCLEMNCRLIPESSIWRSSVHNETNWYGVWKPYNCDYLEFTKTQLQSCINQNQISSIRTVGMSIAEFLMEYLSQRLEGVKMYQPSKDEAPGNTIVLSTLGALHWAAKSDDDLEESASSEIQKILAKTPNTTLYLVPGYFLSSERTPHIHVDRMMLLNSVLAKQHKVVLEAYDMSAAFTYDTATQNDGMHIIGPTMKMIITKLFHHICKDSTEGRRVGNW